MELKDLFFHAAVLIPIEWVVLHSTPLGPILTGMGHELWEGLGFDWGGGALMHEH